MLDVDWLTPVKRRQLSVVGEEGLFELDYLTQRLTFARASDMTNPRLIGGYAPTFSGEIEVIPVDNGEPLVAELEAFIRLARAGGPPVVGRRGRPLGCGHRRRHASGRAASGGRSNWRPHEHPRDPADRPEPARRLDRPATQPVPPRAGAPGLAVDRRARDRRDRRGRRGGEDGPAAGRPVREPRLVGHRGRHRPRGRRRHQRRTVARRRRTRTRRARDARPTPPVACERRWTGPRRRERRTWSS